MDVSAKGKRLTISTYPAFLPERVPPDRSENLAIVTERFTLG
jgi:hypothetical protein